MKISFVAFLLPLAAAGELRGVEPAQEETAPLRRDLEDVKRDLIERDLQPFPLLFLGNDNIPFPLFICEGE